MLGNAVRMLRRRLVMVVVATAIALLAGGSVLFAVPPEQQSKGSVVFVPSIKQPGVEGPTNPLLSLGGSVAIVANVVQIAVTDDDTAQSLINAGHLSKYEVVPDLSENAGPVLTVTSTGSAPTDVVETRDAVIAAIVSKLQTLQDERQVPSDLRVTSVLLTSTNKVTSIHKTQIQLAVLVTAVVWVSLLLLILIRERGVERQARPRTRARPRAAPSSPIGPFGSARQPAEPGSDETVALSADPGEATSVPYGRRRPRPNTTRSAARGQPSHVKADRDETDLFESRLVNKDGADSSPRYSR